MKAVVQENGVWIPKRLLKGVKEVEIRKKNGQIVVQPTVISHDPIFDLGNHPGHSGLGDLSTNHDDYLYGKRA